MTDMCKKCKVEARIHYAAGFDIWTCPMCGQRADGRQFYDHFYEG